jgi:hypothetical protein
VNHKHPLDYIPAAAPIQPEYINHKPDLYFYRFFLQISWKAGDCFIPMTFLLDFNHPFIYFCADAFKVMEDNGLVAYDEEVPVFDHVRIQTGPSKSLLAYCECSPDASRQTSSA